jgi:hypothetical protein
MEAGANNDKSLLANPLTSKSAKVQRVLRLPAQGIVKDCGF